MYIYRRITVDGQSAELCTKIKCKPENWNAAAGRLKGKGDSVKAFNAYLDILQQKVFEAKRKLIETDKELSAEKIKNILLGRENERKHMLLEVFAHHDDQVEALVGREYAQSFLEWKYKLKDIDIKK